MIFLCAGMQGVFAAMACQGTVYLKLPDGWKSAYAVAGGQKVAFTKSSFDGWLQLSAESIGGANEATSFVIEETGANDCNSGHCIRKDSMDVQFLSLDAAHSFKCIDFSSEDTDGELWIQADPAGDPNITYKSKTPPDVKYFYVFLPNNEDWKSTIPYMSIDGAPGEPLSSVPDRCGWYFKRYIDEEPPSNVLIYRDDDETMSEAIGMNGSWETAATPTPIDLKTLFEFFESNTLYFVADEEFSDKEHPETQGWTIVDQAQAVGTCDYSLAAFIYDTDAQLHGAFTCSPEWYEGQTDDEARYNDCYYSTAKYNVVGPNKVVPCIGVTQGMVEEKLVKDANGEKKPVLTTKGKTCFGTQADEAFTAMFNYTEGVNEKYCVDLPFHGTDDGAYEYDSDKHVYLRGANGKDTIYGGFYPAEDEPPAERMMSPRLETAETKRVAQGPVFFCGDDLNQNKTSTTPDGLRTLIDGIPASDLICNGPGWDGGIDCEGLFAAGSEFASNNVLTAKGRAIQNALGVSWWGDGWAWSCQNLGPIGWQFYNTGTETKTGKVTKRGEAPGEDSRWQSGKFQVEYPAGSSTGRNQHFCFESHANFRYKHGLKFSFRGDDDIWVFINDMLAVDLGGTHLAAPGYVIVDDFLKAKGVTLNVGDSYPIDIFFCDRRTTMSNVRIKTNMFIQQTSGLSKDIVDKNKGEETYTLQYCVTGDGSCQAAAAGGSGSNGGCLVGAELCADLAKTGEEVLWRIETKNKDLIKGSDELAAPTVYFGGIDLTDRCDPKINKKTLMGLTPNTYYLIATVRGKDQNFQFKVSGNVDIVTKPAWLQDETANRVPGATYEFTSLALASTDDNPSRIPLFISSIMDQGDSLLLDMGTAIGQPYSLDVFDAAGNPSSDLTLEYKNENGEFVTWSGKSQRSIGEGGVDTIYASVPMAMLTKSEQTYTVKVNGATTAGAAITFFAPKLVFVEDSTSTVAISGDPETNERWTGSVYNFYLLALAPVPGSDTYEPCGDRCNFALAAGSMTSGGIVVDTAGLKLVNGRTMISIYSTKEYRTAGSGSAANPATLSITGPNVLIKADYTPIFFRNPPVPYPVFADMFDSRGKKPSLQMVIDPTFFSMEQEYLDGIADSLVIYYNREFYHSTDSLPTSIVVFWDGEEDSVVVTRDQFADNMVCGSAAGLDDTLCLGRISISGIEFSKDVKTASPGATLKSYAKFMDRGRSVVEEFPGNINDRVAPIIKTASVYAQGEEWNRMTIELSEEVQMNTNFARQGFSVFLNSANSLKDAAKYVVGVESPAALAIAGDKVTINFWSSSDKGLSPHTGDYVRFRADEPIWTDLSVPVLGTDETLRPADDASYFWGYPTDYNSVNRLPSPWAPVTGEAETGVEAIVYTRVGTDNIPTTLTTVKGYPITDDFETVQKDNPGVLGYFLMSDIYSIVYSDSNVAKYFTDPAHQAEVDQIYLEFELDVFTNLGGFVAHESKKVKCNDPTIYGEGHSCLDTQRNFFISWNTVASDGRLVGTGAFISKMKSAVHLGKKGTRAKMDKTKMWGVRRDGQFSGKVVNQ